MFATLKNKIREEIGSDVSTVVKNAGGSIRAINSRHVSQVNVITRTQLVYKLPDAASRHVHSELDDAGADFEWSLVRSMTKRVPRAAFSFLSRE